MARISTYQVDTNVTGADIWIGTDGNDNKKTKNFSPNILAQYLNENEVISTANSLRYRYDTIASGDSRKTGTISFQTEIGANVAFSSITTFILSNKTLGSNTVDAFLNILPNTRILIQNSSNINFFGIYFVNSVTPHLTETGYYVVNLTYVSGNGNLSEDMDYLIHLIEYKTADVPIPTLQTVTDEGNVTTNSMIIENYNATYTTTLQSNVINVDYDDGNQNSYSNISASEISTNYDSPSNINSFAKLSSNAYLELNVDGKSGVINIEDLTDSVTLKFPAKPTGSYTIATTEDVTVPTLQSVTDAGDTTTTTVHLDGGALSDSVNEQAIFNPDQIASTNKTTGSGVSIDSIGNVSLSNGIDSSILSSANVTNPNVVLQFPNKISGDYTIATTSDIPSVTGYIPYTGATTNANLGEYELKAGQLTLDTSPTGTAAVGTTRWNDSIGSSETTLKGGSVILKNGVDLVARVVNKVTPNTTLTKAAYQAVRVSGAQGQRLAVAYAQANNDNNSADTIGLVCETIATNQEGFIMTVGQLEEINTTGSLQGETWVDGNVLYLSPTTPGALTNVKPTGLTGHIVVMGYVEYAHANHGKIYVKIMNGWELDELHNVYINSPVNNEGLFYDSADSLWKNKTVETALGYTPENVANKSTSTSLGTSNTLYPTQNAVKVYADTKFTLPSLTSGSVLFSNGSTIAQDNAQLFWDDTNNFLGIGTPSPTDKLTLINGNFALSNARRIKWATGSYIEGEGTSSLMTFRSLGNFNFTGSNILINTTTDAGFRLDVNGTARVSGTTTITPAALTGTAATSALDIAQTWNTTGTPIALKVNITDTASASLSDLMSLQVGGSVRFRVLKSGYFVHNTGGEITGSLIVGGNSINASARLQVDSLTQGFLPPRMTTTQKNAIATPAVGLIIFDVTLNKLCVRGASAWETITSV